MWRYEYHLPRVMNVATLPCESRNGKNTVGYYQRKLHQTYRNMLHRNGPVDYKIWGVMHQCVYGTKICDICDLHKCLTQTWGWLWTERYRGCDWPVARQSEIMCACWWQTLWIHAAKLLFICIICETVNVIWCIWRLFCSNVISWICVHTHFRCFNFNKVV